MTLFSVSLLAPLDFQAALRFRSFPEFGLFTLISCSCTDLFHFIVTRLSHLLPLRARSSTLHDRNIHIILDAHGEVLVITAAEAVVDQEEVAMLDRRGLDELMIFAVWNVVVVGDSEIALKFDKALQCLEFQGADKMIFFPQ